jgi:glycosyltransferase involved in cell wall biosynthesis
MRIVLLTLSGDPGIASESLQRRYAEPEIIPFSRASLESGSLRTRLAALRYLKPDVFAVMTESLQWQYGQNALMLFGALGGARESIILDARGAMNAAARAQLVARAPFRIAQNFLRGRLAVQNAGKTLERLEYEIKKTKRACNGLQFKKDQNPTVAYLRATPSAGTQPGGATSHINGVVKALISLGAQIHFISNDEIAGLDKEKILFDKILPDPNIMPRAAFDIYNGAAFSSAAADIIAASPPSFIYQRYSRFSWAGVEASLHARVPLFLEYNGSEVWIGKHWDKTEKLDLLERCERLNLEAASRIFVISEVERNNLLSVGLADEKIVVNPNGVDADEFHPGIGGDKIRAELGLPKDRRLVGFVGTFGPWHGVLALAEAIALTAKNAGLHFLLIGDGSLRSEVKAKLGASGDLERMTFAGVVSHERIPAFLDACDILVSPHVPLADGREFFGSPTKLFEYMAAGKGIVASRLGQIGDVLSDNETALLVEPGNPKELSDAMLKLADDAVLLSRLGAAAREAAIGKHTWKINAKRVLDEFSD